MIFSLYEIAHRLVNYQFLPDLIAENLNQPFCLGD
jgi:hypothetical protein